jgi:hypothetical protein
VKIIKIHTIIFLILICNPAIAQVIDSIAISGFKKMDSTYLARFIYTRIDSSIDSNIINNDLNRLKSLPGIYNAHYNIKKKKGKTVLEFHIKEQRTLLPTGDFGLTDDSYWIGAGIVESNFSGRGIYFYGFYQYYDRHSVFLNLEIPYLFNTKWGINTYIKKWSTNEPLYFNKNKVIYEYDNNSLELTTRYEFEHDHSIEFGGSVLLETYTKKAGQNIATAPEMVDKDKILAKIIYRKKKLKYHFFYLDGVANQLFVENVSTVNEEVLYPVIFNELKIYHRATPKINLAWRLKTGLSRNKNSPFSPFVLDSYVNIRGVGNRVDRGTGTIVLNAEYRHTLYENPTGAIQSVVFTDLGSWRNPGGSFQDFVNHHNIKTFAGAGLRFIYKKAYDAVLRIDYGIDMMHPGYGGWVIGVGQYF